MVRFPCLCLGGDKMKTDNILRSEMEKELKKELHSLALKTRDRLDLTQHEMADRYAMAESSYNMLEKGRYKCGTLTTVLLLKDQEDPKKALEELAEKLEKVRDEIMVSV